MKRILLSCLTCMTVLVGISLNAGQNTAQLSQYQPYIDQAINYGSKYLSDWLSGQQTTQTSQQPNLQTSAHRETTGLIGNQENKLENLIAQRDGLKRQIINIQEQINKLRATLAAEHKRKAIHPHNMNHQHGNQADTLSNKIGNWLNEQLTQPQ